MIRSMREDREKKNAATSAKKHVVSPVLSEDEKHRLSNTQEHRSLSDEELCVLAATDDGAESELLARYKGLVLTAARAYYILGADREDVIQEGMIGLFKAIHHFDPAAGSSFAAYASVCVRRQIMDAVKAAARKKHEPLNRSVSLDEEESAGRADALAADIGAAAEALLAGDGGQVLPAEEALWEKVAHDWRAEFSKLEFKVLEGYVAGKSYGELAEELDKDSKSVYNAMVRIKGKIRKLAALNSDN